MKAKKYPKIDKCPSNAMSVKDFSEKNNMAYAYVYVKYDRALQGTTTVNYKIFNYLNFNVVVPD